MIHARSKENRIKRTLKQSIYISPCRYANAPNNAAMYTYDATTLKPDSSLATRDIVNLLLISARLHCCCHCRRRRRIPHKTLAFHSSQTHNRDPEPCALYFCSYFCWPKVALISVWVVRWAYGWPLWPRVRLCAVSCVLLTTARGAGPQNQYSREKRIFSRKSILPVTIHRFRKKPP